MEEQLKELHETHDYFVSVMKCKDSNSIIVQLPSNIIDEQQIDGLEVVYTISEDTIIKSRGSQVIGSIQVPKYLSRCMVIADLILICLRFNISSLLITCFDDDGRKINDPNFETYDLMDVPDSIEDQEKEKSMKRVFKAMLNGRTDCPQMSKAANVEDGYELLLQVFRSGGF